MQADPLDPFVIHTSGFWGGGFCFVFYVCLFYCFGWYILCWVQTCIFIALIKKKSYKENNKNYKMYFGELIDYNEKKYELFLPVLKASN